MDAQTRARIAHGSNRAAMGLDDGPADRQPNAETRRLGGGEGLEDALEIALLDPNASVPDAYLHDPRHRLRRLNGKPPEPAGGLRHRVLRVQREIQDHLLELDGIAVYQGKPLSQAQLSRDPRVLQVGLQESDHLDNEPVDIARLPVGLALPKHRAQAPDHLR